jgi:hypothetical protein
MIDILKKFKFKAIVTVINAPFDLSKVFVAMGFPSAFDKKNKSIDTLIFINNQK